MEVARESTWHHSSQVLTLNGLESYPKTSEVFETSEVLCGPPYRRVARIITALGRCGKDEIATDRSSRTASRRIFTRSQGQGSPTWAAGYFTFRKPPARQGAG
jgi:hypothetical protein